jgi:hypothetical protein
MSEKLTPQEFLDSTEFSYLTMDSLSDGGISCPTLHQNVPFTIPDAPKMYAIYWALSDGGCLTLGPDEIKSIDWSRFDCTKPIKRNIR